MLSGPLAITLVSLSLSAATSPIEPMRTEAEALLRIQGVLGWYTRTQGEPSIGSLTYAGHDRLFSKASVTKLNQMLKARGLSADDTQALKYFRNYLASEFIGQST